MGKKDLQCLFIGDRSKIYADLLTTLKGFDLNLQVKLVDADKKRVSRALKKLRAASLVFISDEVLFSVNLLSDLVWLYAPDAIVIIITEKTISTSLKTPFNHTQFSKLHFEKKSDTTNLHLQYLIQAVQIKWDFRRCKRLLGVSEKRCQWLVDSSSEAIAFISRDLHLYANTAYIGLFDIASIRDLPTIAVKELIMDDEHGLFKSFVEKQSKKHDMNRSLVVSLKSINGKPFRANVHVIPSVFKGHKCLQLWVHPLNRYEFNQYDQDKAKTDVLLFEPPTVNEVLEERKVSSASLLKEIIKRKEATISAQTLVKMNPNENRTRASQAGNHIVSLKVPEAQRVGIDDLLFRSNDVNKHEQRQIFWDKVKLTRLLQILMKKEKLELNLFVCLSEATLVDKPFSDWFLPGLRKIGGKASHLTFLLSTDYNQSQIKSVIKFVNALRVSNCKVALDDFSVSERSLQLLKIAKPDYVRLSLPWVKKIEGNNARELALASFIRQLESKNIKVVAPCGFSTDMRKLFALSGVSFCQERTRKTA